MEIRAQKELNAPRLFILGPARDSLIKNFKSIKGFYTMACYFQTCMKKEKVSNLS